VEIKWHVSRGHSLTGRRDWSITQSPKVDPSSYKYRMTARASLSPRPLANATPTPFKPSRRTALLRDGLLSLSIRLRLHFPEPPEDATRM